jgi:hypothetical protein
MGDDRLHLPESPNTHCDVCNADNRTLGFKWWHRGKGCNRCTGLSDDPSPLAEEPSFRHVPTVQDWTWREGYAAGYFARGCQIIADEWQIRAKKAEADLAAHQGVTAAERAVVEAAMAVEVLRRPLRPGQVRTYTIEAWNEAFDEMGAACEALEAAREKIR